MPLPQSVCIDVVFLLRLHHREEAQRRLEEAQGRHVSCCRCLRGSVPLSATGNKAAGVEDPHLVPAVSVRVSELDECSAQFHST
jgi:hypothetical protein